MDRKSLFDISWKVSEEEYRADPAYSYSTIARFNREGFNNIDKLFDKIETPSLVFGSMVDTLLTDGQEEFDNRFVVAQFPDIPDSIIKIAKDLFREFGDMHRRLEDIPDEEVSIKATLFNYQPNWKPETRVRVIKEKGAEYYSLLSLAVSKTLVSTNDYLDAVNCVETLRNHPYTEDYFKPNNPFDTDIERFYQLKFKGEWNGIPLRCMADLIIVDHKSKRIIPCDLKTSSKKEWDFHKSFIDWNYWIQAQLYWYIIRQNLDKDELYKNYTLENYRFIVISRNSKKPLVWEYSDTKSVVDCYYGRNKQYVCKNWRGLVATLHYYLTSRPDYPINIDKINNIEIWLNNE